MTMENLLKSIDQAKPYDEIGLVEQVVGITIETKGPKGKIGDLCLIETDDPECPKLYAEVVGFRAGRLILMPLGEMANLSPGCRVINTSQPFQVSVGPELIGRVVDGLGQPLDDRFDLSADNRRAVTAHAPHP